MLTDLKIRNEGKGASRREIPDGKIAGLYLVVQPTGAKSWAVRYRVDGQPKKFTIGAYPAIDRAAARKRAQEALGEVAGGNAFRRQDRRPRGAQGRRVDGRPRRRSRRDVHRAMREAQCGRRLGARGRAVSPQGDLPGAGKKRLDDVKISDVHDLLDAIVDCGAPIVANRALAIFRRLCNWAIERGIIAVSPCDKIKAPAAEQSRDRVLTDDEVRLAWGAFDQIGWPFGPIAKLLLLTGARRDEVGSATWAEIDLVAKTWTIAKERSKNGVAHEVPLSDAAVAILAAIPRMGERKDALVFSTTGKTAVSGFSKGRRKLMRRCSTR
ncbi:MAG: integrase family protein [Pseudomonadota bacterium]|nr:integrase family protein [Pseudomonadota bacterium]